jgi:hypothetical protein
MPYIKANQEIICGNCQQRHAYDMLDSIKAFGMLCPACKEGVCKVVNLSRKYEKLINTISKENLLPSTELGILKTLHDEKKDLFANQIAAELDCSYQLVGKRGKILSERNLIIRGEDEKGRRIFGISESANSLYFVEVEGDKMSFDTDPS